MPKPPLFDDRPLMLLGIPAFGFSIPWLTGLYGTLRMDDLRWWWGCAAFVGLAAAIWLGNRWLLFKQRQHLNWFAHPLRKLLMLVTANVLYTAPLTFAVLWSWYQFSGLPLDRNALQVVTLTNVICVLFVTHAYETMFLIRERESDLLQVERLERARTQAELGALKAQVDPHFLFNSLNTLGHLITHDSAAAREFCDILAELYRYVLDSRQRDLVPLQEELSFVRRYQQLLGLRFGPAVQVQWAEALTQQHRLLPPLALQTLVENAFKHNEASTAQPLLVSVDLQAQQLVVRNARQPRRSALPSAGLGLSNLDERCRLLTGQPLHRVEGPSFFEVRLPTLPAA